MRLEPTPALLTLLLAGCAAAPDSGASSDATLEPTSPADRAAAQRQFTPAAPGVLTARISSQLQADLTAEGLVARAGTDTLALRTAARDGTRLEPVPPALGDCAPTSEVVGADCAPAAELDHGPVTEWWTASPGGVRQGWTLRAPTDAGAAETVLTVTLPMGAVDAVDPDGQGAWLTGTTGRSWRYEDLAAWDADGRDLPVRLVAAAGALEVVVETVGAAWPVTVDPSLATADKFTSSDGASGDQFGSAMSAAGDINGDGYPDVIVGAPHDQIPSTSGRRVAGAAYV